MPYDQRCRSVSVTASTEVESSITFLTRAYVGFYCLVLAVLGTGLIFVSLMAFQHSISPESQSQSLDRALATFEKSELVRRLIQMVTFPWYALITCKDALVWLLILPFRAVAGALKGMGRAGNATIDALNRCLHLLINLPIQLAQYFTAMIGYGLTRTSAGLSNQSRQIGKTLSGSSLGIFFHALADGFSSATTGMKSAWTVSNRVVGDYALALEKLVHEAIKALEKGVAKTVAGWLTTKSIVVGSRATVRTQWIAVNRTVADTALLFDSHVKLVMNLTMESWRRLRTRTTNLGINKESIRAASLQGKYLVDASYSRANAGATRIGFFMEGIMENVFIKLKGLVSPKPTGMS